MATRDEKLAEFSRAWRDADDNYRSDVIAANGDLAKINAIDANRYKAQANWAEAEAAALEKDSAAIDQAYQAAKAANDQVAAARQGELDLDNMIGKWASAASALDNLLSAVG